MHLDFCSSRTDAKTNLFGERDQTAKLQHSFFVQPDSNSQAVVIEDEEVEYAGNESPGTRLRYVVVALGVMQSNQGPELQETTEADANASASDEDLDFLMEALFD